jgi:hypothetical protein
MKSDRNGRVFREARRRFGDDPFTNFQLAELLREFVSPMEAARMAERHRGYARDSWRRRFGVVEGPGQHANGRKDDVLRGNRIIANMMTSSWAGHNPHVERVAPGTFRFVEGDRR